MSSKESSMFFFFFFSCFSPRFSARSVQGSILLLCFSVQLSLRSLVVTDTDVSSVTVR